jgi:hypothetical protein
MIAVKTEEKHSDQEKRLRDDFPIEGSMPLLFLGMVIISIFGYFEFGGHWMEIITNHLGGLGVIGLFACLSGFIAKKKGHNYQKVFLLSFILPIILGFDVSFILFFLADMECCGGGVVLATSLLAIIYSSIKPRNVSA